MLNDIFNVPDLAYVERDTSGNWWNMLDTDRKTKKLTDKDRLAIILSNPAVLKVFSLQCELFSLGRINAVKNNKDVQNDKLVNLLNYPNPFQSQRKFLWDYMFWNMMGTAYLYSNSSVISDDTKLYFLDPSRFNWTDELVKKIDKVVLSKKSFSEIESLTVNYNNMDGTVTKYKLSEIKPLFDLSGGVGNWFKGNSRIDALWKIICNSEVAMDAKYTNLDFSRKFIVHGTQESGDVYNTPMGDEEVKQARQSIKGKENVQIVKSKVDIKAYVDSIVNKNFDQSYWSDFFMIGSMYNIPKEVLDAYLQSSTFENQEKARGAHVEQALQPKGSDLMDTIERMFGYDNVGIDLKINWDHLSFMQVFKKTKNENIKAEIDNILLAFNNGAIDDNDKNERIKSVLNG